MWKKTLLISTALWLSACTQNPALSPPPQQMTAPKVDKTTQKGSVSSYLCKENKIVNVVYTQKKQKNKKNLSHVTLTFNGMTEKLSRVISERGKNYANIRWYWQERSDYSMLRTTIGEVLAEQCVLQTNAPNETK